MVYWNPGPQGRTVLPETLPSATAGAPSWSRASVPLPFWNLSSPFSIKACGCDSRVIQPHNSRSSPHHLTTTVILPLKILVPEVS